MTPAPRVSTSTVAARIPYANAAPFYALWSEAPFAVRNLAPRDLGHEAEAGTVDLGLMAAADFLRLRDRFELLGPMGVATRGAVQSVLLFSRKPAAALGGGVISVTPETSTSIRLPDAAGVRRSPKASALHSWGSSRPRRTVCS
jgi:predicted solute-binding protein